MEQKTIAELLPGEDMRLSTGVYRFDKYVRKRMPRLGTVTLMRMVAVSKDCEFPVQLIGLRLYSQTITLIDGIWTQQ